MKLPKLFTPVGNLAALEKLPDIEKRDVFVPDTVTQDWRTPLFQVVVAGPECKWVKEGDIVLCNMQAPLTKIRYAEHEWFMINEGHVAATLNSDEREEVLKKCAALGQKSILVT